MRAAIVADDLTGACDSAARAALAGWRPRVLLNGIRSGPNISVVSTATRNSSPHDASDAVSEVARALLACAVRPLFKKIDSTLRGPWAAEVTALAAVTGAEVIAVCPAFPAVGRTVRDGVVYRDGEAVGELRGPLEAAGAVSGHELLVGDAETEADISEFVSSVAALGRTVLWVGSAGLAEFAFGFRHSLPIALPRPKQWLIISGTNHSVARAQLEVARAAGLEIVVPDLRSRRIDPGTGLFFIGGDSFARAAQRLRIAALDVVGESLPGIAVGTVVGGEADGCVFMSKSGAFGGARTVIEAVVKFSDLVL